MQASSFQVSSTLPAGCALGQGGLMQGRTLHGTFRACAIDTCERLS